LRPTREKQYKKLEGVAALAGLRCPAIRRLSAKKRSAEAERLFCPLP
jgi:hypothetical protein